MIRATIPNSKPALSAIKKRFELWREERRKRCPIPEELWEAAVALAKEHSLHRISRTLRLNYSDLSKRVEKKRTEFKHRGHGAAFVQFDIGEAMGAGAEWVFEMESNRGPKMKMSYRGLKATEFVEAARVFWEETR